MSIPTGLSTSKLASYKQEAAKVIARFDTNKDGQLDRTEADRQVFLNRDSYSFTNRISHDYVTRTTVTQEHSAVVKAGAFERVDADRDGKISADEMVGTYLNEQDNNKDGNLSWWERLWMGGASSMVSAVQGKVSREVDRTSRLEYNPERDDDRPTPPSPDRPTPPSPDRPTPPSPGRPTPPSPSRPTPPSPGGSDRPTPPRPDSDRPTPPSPSGSRPTPPRP